MNALQKLSDREIHPGIGVEHFDILDFYGSLSIFLWKDNKLFILPHEENFDEDIEIIDPSPLTPKVLTSPKTIESVCSYSGRVFVVCSSSGIYKLSQSLKFVVLSESGIGLGCEFHQVLSPSKGWLYLADKFTKKSTALFRLSNETGSIQQKILSNPTGSPKSTCLIASGKKLYKLTGEIVKLLHVETSPITEIVLIKKTGGKIFGIGLITSGNYLVLLLPETSDWKFLNPCKKVYYDGGITALALYCSPTSPLISSFHSNGHNIYHRTINPSAPGERTSHIDVVFTHEGPINCLRFCNQRILALADGNHFMEFATSTTMAQNEKREFHPLRDDMIKNTNIIVERICERVRELEIVNRQITASQKRLEGVNAYAHHQKTQYTPRIRIIRRCGRDFLEAKLESLPEGSRLFVNVKMGEQRVFGSKVVMEKVTTIEVPLEITDFDIEKFDLRIDLVPTESQGKLWCILNNCSQKVGRGSTKAREDFLRAKAETLRSLVEKEGLDEVKLRYIKRSIRKD